MSRTRYDGAKRVLDVCGAVLGLALLWPVMLLIGLAVRLSMGSPVLFRQARSGRHGRAFTIYKFRTMRPGEEPDSDRITPLGWVLRATSLDELPELCNVVRGDMSLVGPRPLLREYLHSFTPAQARRHDVRPGLTGWAQVHGCDDRRWDERLRMDAFYVRHRSLALDLRILLRTFVVVVERALRHQRPGSGEVSAGRRAGSPVPQPVPGRR